jgi:hypothetical protein
MMRYESGAIGKWLALLKEIAPRGFFAVNTKFQGCHNFLRFAKVAAQRSRLSSSQRSIESLARMPGGRLLRGHRPWRSAWAQFETVPPSSFVPLSALAN